MDLLFQRYANPFLLIEETIKTDSFSGFVSDFVGILNEENEDKVLWEFYLHRVFEKSYSEFLATIKTKKQPEKPVDFEAAINESVNILNGFVPE